MTAPAVPEESEWAALPRRSAPGPGALDVVMPVYGDEAASLRAIQRVLAARCEQPLRLLVIDDASPHPTLSARIDRLAADGMLRVLRNARNRGFVVSANRGLREAPGDVVLLNADTEVYDGWLDRLRAVAHAAPDVASATPLSNAATILSYPYWLRDSHEALELSPAQLDALAAGLGLAPVEIPTAIGFCMYLRGDALRQVGLLDEAAFGRGYGEENDWCLRATALGWRHLAAVDTFVHHWGGRSFGAEKAQRLREAMRTLARLHPGYEATIRDFIARDPLAGVRATLDAARLRRGGGTLHLQRVSRWSNWRWHARMDGVACTPNLPLLDLRRTGEATALLRELQVRHITALPGWALGRQRRALRALAGQCGATLV